MKIRMLMDAIRAQGLVLPEFQREYVWRKEQSKQLMDSLFKRYPVGSLLFWSTENPPELKGIPELPDKLGMFQVILDGQQRLTTLYMLIIGEIPPFYTDRDIKYDPRDLFFSLDTGEFQYYRASLMKGSRLWWRVVDCYKEKVKVFEIAKKQAATDSEVADLAERYTDNLNTLRAIRDIDLPEQTVPSHATIDDSIDIFDLVNSQGTPLSDADLALAHVTGKWPGARATMKEKIADLEKHNFHFRLSFMTRALTGVVVRRALFETIHERKKPELQEGWRHLARILDYLVTILPNWACIHSTDDLNTANVLVPLVVYLSLNDGKFPGEKALKNAVHWLYAAHIWSRYTSQTDQRLEHDLSLVVREISPWDVLRTQIIDQRGRIEVKANDLEGRGIQHPMYRMTFILAKAHGAIDWFNGVPLDTVHGEAYRRHSHHIFPVSVLYKNGYDPENHLHRKIVNEIANRASLSAETNLKLSAAMPEEYLPQVEEKYPGALVRQFIPMDPALWKVERYADFLAARRELIALKTNEFMRSLISEPEIVAERPILELIALGESATLEFKSTLQWDVVQGRTNKELHLSVLKTIAAFLNSGGGTLVIGVEDNGHVLGLEHDLKGMKQGSLDRFGQLLANIVSQRIGPQYGPFIRARFERTDGREVCVVDVDKAPEPAFVKGKSGSEFHVRVGPTTRSLDPQETLQYMEMNWG